MSEVQELKSYLVSLGFAPKMQEYARFESTLKGAASLVKSLTFSMGSDLLKWQVAITSGFLAVSGAIVGTIDKVAMADQEYRLFGQRMFMSTNQAKSLKIALDALGQPLEAIAFDPELHGRFDQLQKDQRRMQGGLGGDFESTMRQIRDVRFEFTRFEVELQYFVAGVAKDVFEALGFGSGGLAGQLHNINEWIITNLPRWSKEFSQDLVPVLKDTWEILKDIGEFAAIAATAFSNLIGVISGDSSIEGSTFSFHKLAGAVAHVVVWAKQFLDIMIAIEKFLLPFAGTIGGALGGASVGGTIGGVLGIPGGPAGVLAGAGTGTAIGAGVGAAGGAALDLWRAIAGSHGGGATGGAGTSGSIADAARSLAATVGARLGVDPSIIYAQWAHETGNFTNRGSTQLNNLAGVNIPGGKGQDYRSFGSLEEFGNYYTSLIQHRYGGAVGAQSSDAYASALKSGGYFTAPLSAYQNSMRAHMGDYSRGGGSTTVNVGGVHIAGSNATPDQITHAVAKGIKQATDTQNQRNLTELKTIYG